MAQILGREAERGQAEGNDRPLKPAHLAKPKNPDHLDIDTQGSRQREQRCAQPVVDPIGKTTETIEKILRNPLLEGGRKAPNSPFRAISRLDGELWGRSGHQKRRG